MSAEGVFTFHKQERLCSKKLIDLLFNGGSHTSVSVWPLRAVFLLTDKPADKDVPVQVLISVSKRSFKRAVKRNRVKRQIREAYRKNKALLHERLREHPDKMLLVAFLWIDDKIHRSEKVEAKLVKLLQRMGEQL